MATSYGIAVAGGGPSGMTAAITAARLGARVVLLETQPRIGRKLLSTGNGRCNVTNTRISPVHFRSRHPRQVESVITRVPPNEVMLFLSSIGLECFEEREGRVYPRSEQASSVLDMLRAELERLGVEIISDSRVTGITPAGKGFSVKTSEHTVNAEKVIMACGSQAAPQLGGSPDGLSLMKKLGHKTLPFTPALVGLRVDSPHLKALKGVRWRCRLTLMYNGTPVHTEDGELQFNEDNLSGIVTMQMSSRIARLGSGCVLCVDLLPEYDDGQTCALFSDLSQRLGHLPLDCFLAGLFNKRLAVCLLKQAGITGLNRPASALSGRDINKLAAAAKDWRFSVTDNCGWKVAQVASGGVLLDQMNDRLESKAVSGLYACGELLDCDGDCGGYNLHWAWCTGILAGRSAAEALNK